MSIASCPLPFQHHDFYPHVSSDTAWPLLWAEWRPALKTGSLQSHSVTTLWSFLHTEQAIDLPKSLLLWCTTCRPSPSLPCLKARVSHFCHTVLSLVISWGPPSPQSHPLLLGSPFWRPSHHVPVAIVMANISLSTHTADLFPGNFQMPVTWAPLTPSPFLLSGGLPSPWERRRANLGTSSLFFPLFET